MPSCQQSFSLCSLCESRAFYVATVAKHQGSSYSLHVHCAMAHVVWNSGRESRDQAPNHWFIIWSSVIHLNFMQSLQCAALCAGSRHGTMYNVHTASAVTPSALWQARLIFSQVLLDYLGARDHLCCSKRLTLHIAQSKTMSGLRSQEQSMLILN